MLPWNQTKGQLNLRSPSPVVISRECLIKSAQLFVDDINSKDELLWDYEIELRFANQEHADMFMLRSLVEFEEEETTNLLRAPFFFGPINGCPTPASMYLYAPTKLLMDRYYLSQLLSSQCGNDNGRDAIALMSPKPFNWRPFTDFVDKLTLMAFAWSRNGGNWRQVGLITFYSDIAQKPIQTMTTYNKILQSNGVKIVWSALGDSHYKMFLELKQAKARIIIVNSQVDQRSSCLICVDIYCSAHKAGVRAPHYTLLFPGYNCLDCLFDEVPNTTPDNMYLCSKAIQFEQAKIALFSANGYYALASNPVNLKTYVQALSDFVSDVKFPTLEQTQLLNSSGCNIDSNVQDDLNVFKESVLAGLYTLNLTEQKLRGDYNFSLSDIPKVSNGSKLLGKTFTDSANELEFIGSLGGRIWSRVFFTGMVMQIDSSDNPVFGQPNYTIRRVALVVPFTTGADGNQHAISYNFSDYDIAIDSEEIVWATPDKKPPKDLSEVEHRNRSYNWAVFNVLIAASSAIITIQLLLAVLAIRQRRDFLGQKKRMNLYFDYESNFILLLGCFLLNISAIVLLTGTSLFPEIYCKFRPTLSVIALSLVNGTLFGRMESLKTFTELHIYVNSRLRNDPNLNFDIPEHERKRRIEVKHMRINARKSLLLILTISAIGLLVWLIQDPIQLDSVIQYEEDPIFDPIGDTFFDIRVEWCQSTYEWHLTGAFILFNAILLFIALFQAVLMKRSVKHVRKRFRQEINRLRLATANATSIFVFSILLVAVVPSSGLLSYLQVAIFAVSQLIFSLSTSVIVFSPFLVLLKSRLRIGDKNKIEPFTIAVPVDETV